MYFTGTKTTELDKSGAKITVFMSNWKLKILQMGL